MIIGINDQDIDLEHILIVTMLKLVYCCLSLIKNPSLLLTSTSNLLLTASPIPNFCSNSQAMASGNLYFWIQGFLNNRSQYVKINSSYSLPCSVFSGVIRGSVIGSLLINIFINDWNDPFHFNTTVKLFADDIKLYTSYINISQNNLQHDINTMYDWASIWQMQISYSKCNILQISTNTLPQYYKINTNIVAGVDSMSLTLG